jgi:hypothetical protein
LFGGFFIFKIIKMEKKTILRIYQYKNLKNKIIHKLSVGYCQDGLFIEITKRQYNDILKFYKNISCDGVEIRVKNERGFEFVTIIISNECAEKRFYKKLSS